MICIINIVSDFNHVYFFRCLARKRKNIIGMNFAYYQNRNINYKEVKIWVY